MKKCTACNSDSPKNRKLCNACRYAKSKLENPILVAFTSLRSHAKARSKEFSLTLEQFTEFCIRTEYITKRGITANGYHIDRVDETLGYTHDNIQILKNSDNVRKYRQFIERRNGIATFTTVTVQEHSCSDDTPF